jgi:hypothetical protein
LKTGDNEMTRLPITAEVRGRYRVWQAIIQRTVDRLDAMSARALAYQDPFLSDVTGKFIRARGIGQQRALKHLRRSIESAGARFIDVDDQRARWAYLRPHPGEVTAYLITISDKNNGQHAWLIRFTEHALQRAMQRGGRGLDLTAAIWQAVDNARRLNMRFLLHRTGFDRFRISAGDGAFACELITIEIRGNKMPLISANSWLHADQRPNSKRLKSSMKATQVSALTNSMRFTGRNGPCRESSGVTAVRSRRQGNQCSCAD